LNVDAPQRAGLRSRNLAFRSCNLESNEGIARSGHDVFIVCLPLNWQQAIKEPPYVQGDILHQQILYDLGRSSRSDDP